MEEVSTREDIDVKPADVPLPVDDMDEPGDAADPAPEGGKKDIPALDEPLSARTFNSEFRVPKTHFSSFATGFDPHSAEEMEKRRKRAEKFGCEVYNPEARAKNRIELDPEKARSRAERFGQVERKEAVPDVEKAKADPVSLVPERRLNAVHVCGTWMANKKTREILQFFEDYGPQYVEWINLYACNIVFNDEAGAKRALVLKSDEPDLEKCLSEEQQQEAQARGLDRQQLLLWFWRTAVASKQGAVLLMRLATTEDVKKHPGQRKGFNLYFNKVKKDLQVPDTRLPEDRDSSMGQGQGQQRAPHRRRAPRAKVTVESDSEEDLTVPEGPQLDNKGRVIRGRGIKVARREVPSGDFTRAHVERKGSGKMAISLSKVRQGRTGGTPYDRKPLQVRLRREASPEQEAAAGSVLDAVMDDDDSD